MDRYAVMAFGYKPIRADAILATMPKTGLILFAHGARDPRWAEPFVRLRHKVAAARPATPVVLAFLELMKPDLVGAAAELVAVGCTALRIVPVFLGQGGHVREDLPAQIRAVEAAHPGIEVALRPAVGEDDAVLDRIAEVAVRGIAER
jgi:sirohydrochlorin cobaltochelatase